MVSPDSDENAKRLAYSRRFLSKKIPTCWPFCPPTGLRKAVKSHSCRALQRFAALFQQSIDFLQNLVHGADRSHQVLSEFLGLAVPNF